jgi:hypothetical protein
MKFKPGDWIANDDFSGDYIWLINNINNEILHWTCFTKSGEQLSSGTSRIEDIEGCIILNDENKALYL